MLTTLIESRAQRPNSFRAQSLSVGLHAALIAGAVLATQRVVSVVGPVVAEPVTYVQPVTDVPPRPATPRVDLPRIKGIQIVTAPLVIPDVLPPIDITRPITDPRDYIGPGLPGGHPDGVQPSIDSAPLTADQVDVPARLMPGSGRPAYPESLRSAGLAGEVNVQFVIDTLGRADMRTLAIISSTHYRFTETVRRALERARFAPAEFGGRKVRQVVRMPFVFSIQK